MAMVSIEDAVKSILQLIIMQLNMLLCLVNDVLDIKMITHGNYEQKIEKFCPKEVFDYIIAMFKP